VRGPLPSREPRSFRLVALRLVLSLFTVLVSLGFAEIAFRILTREGQFYDTAQVEFWKANLRRGPNADAPRKVDIEYDPMLGWRMKRNFRGEEGGVPVFQNSEGFRGREEFSEAPGDRPRILVLGASMAYGLGVTDDEVFTARLAQKYGAEAIDAGVNAFGADQALLMWELEGRRFRPAIVLLVYHVDDFYRVGLPIRDLPKPYFVEADGGFQLAGVPVPRVEELASSGALEPPGTLRVVQAYQWLVRRARWRIGRPDPVEMERLRRLNAYVLERLRDSTGASGARFLVLVAGHCFPDPAFAYSEAAVLELTRRLGIETIDAAAEMQDPRDASYGENCHWSPRAHERVADEVAERLALPPVPND